MRTSKIFMLMRETTVFLFLCIAKALPFFKAQFKSSRNFPTALYAASHWLYSDEN